MRAVDRSHLSHPIWAPTVQEEALRRLRTLNMLDQFHKEMRARVIIQRAVRRYLGKLHAERQRA